MIEKKWTNLYIYKIFAGSEIFEINISDHYNEYSMCNILSKTVVASLL